MQVVNKEIYNCSLARGFFTWEFLISWQAQTGIEYTKKHYDFQKSMDNYYYFLKGKAYSAVYNVLLVLL